MTKENMVYHYTSPEGLYSILNNKTLWFTDCQYLNDKKELLYIREPFTDAHRRVNEVRGSSNVTLDNFINYICMSPYEKSDTSESFDLRKHSFPKYRYYVLCASHEYDSINMWNYYVKNGRFCGYNLGLDTDIICDWFSQCSNDKISIEKGEIIYNKQRQYEILYDELFDLINEYYRRVDRCPEAIERFTDILEEDISDFINYQKLFFKNPSFECEKEFRYILKVPNSFRKRENLDTKFRVGTSGIITPYIEWKFEKLNPLPLKKITLSPMIEEELANISFNRFLNYKGLSNISIKSSSINLRY